MPCLSTKKLGEEKMNRYIQDWVEQDDPNEVPKKKKKLDPDEYYERKREDD